MIRLLVLLLAVLLAVPGATLPPAESSETRRSPADHTECARFLNNFDSTPGNKRGYRIQDYGSLTNDRLHYLPFHVASDGALSPFPDTDTSCNPGSRTCTYTYLSPPLDHLEDIHDRERVNALITADDPRLVKTAVIVQRDRNGNITELREGLPPNHHEPTAERPYNSIQGVRTSFEIRNDTCVPMRQWEAFTREVAENGTLVMKEVESPVFITPLCRDIRQFVENHSEVAAVFDPALGQDMREVFKRHESDIMTIPAEGMPFYSKTELEAEMGRRLNIKADHHGPVHIQAIVGYYASRAANLDGTATYADLRMRMQRLKASPLLSALQILSHCYYRGLRDFTNNDALWE